MEWISYLIKVIFILLGIATVIIAKYLTMKLLLPKPQKNKVIGEKKYIKCGKMTYYYLWFYYLLPCIALMLIDGFPIVILILITLIPLLRGAANLLYSRKYIKPIKWIKANWLVDYNKPIFSILHLQYVHCTN